MAQDPAFFVSVVCAVFKAAGDNSEPTEDMKTKARYAFELLSSFKLMPGSVDGPASGELQAWIAAARSDAAESGRANAADQFIGQALAHASLDPDDNAWPHRIIRDLIESVGSEEIERGIQTGRSNMQGAHAINPKHPAALERHLAAQARTWAGAVVRWPRTEAMLKSMAEHWEWLAGALEQRARQDAMRD